MKTLFALLFASIAWSTLAAPMKAASPVGVLPFTSDDLSMERHKIRDTDERIWLFNGRHRVHAARWSTTAFFMRGYKFRFDFVEKRSGTRIMDNINEDPGDPLGYNFRTGGNMNISCVSGMEAIWSGIFGLRPQENGTMIITPAPFNPEVGEAELAGYQFRHHRHDVRLGKTGYEVFVDGKLHSRESYGQSVTVPPFPPN